MARHKLTDAGVKAAGPGRHGDGDGLWLYVSKAGHKSWVFIFRRGELRREMGLGGYGNIPGKISLREARARADEARELLKDGRDPFTEMAHRRRFEKARTFGAVADDLLTSKEATFRNDKHRAQWKMTLEVYAKPLRKLPVEDVSTDDVVRVLAPLWSQKHETASRLRGRIEKVLDYAKALGLRDGENPARWKGHLDHLLVSPKRKPKHHAAMPYVDVGDFFVELESVDGFGARALELCILTATRSSEILLAQWSEIDRAGELWTIPAERMKAGKEHVVPLSGRALDVIDRLATLRMNEWLFPGQAPRRPISNMTMLATMRRMGKGHFTAHGFRSSFRDWAGDHTSFQREVIEAALAHTVESKVEAAYRRGTAIEKRRKLMQAWANYVAKPRKRTDEND